MRKITVPRTLEGFEPIEAEHKDGQEIIVANAELAGGDGETELKALIDITGKVIMQAGTAIEGSGITDKQGKPYPAGIDQYGTIYANGVDDKNNIISGKSFVKNVKFNFKYDFKTKKFIDPAEMRKKYSNAKIRAIVDDILKGDGVFWSKVAKLVPEASSGYEVGDSTLRRAAFIVIKDWILTNVPGMED